MFGHRGIQHILLRVRSQNGTLRRNQSVGGGVPKKPLTRAEYLIYGFVMYAGLLFMPVNTLYHLREYAGTDKPEE